jgi:hypothetical protein
LTRAAAQLDAAGRVGDPPAVTSREDVTAVFGRAIVTSGWRRAAALLAASCLVFGLAACNDDGDDEADGVDEQPVLEVETGTPAPVCMQVDEQLPAEVETLPIIDCALSHTHEIYSTMEYPDDVFPGIEALDDFAEVKCLEAFEPFVGTSPFDSTLSYSWLVPMLQGWNDEDDREVLCVLMDRDGTPLVGTMRDSLV